MKKATLPEGPPAIKEPGWKGFKFSSSTWNKKDSSPVYVPVTWKKGLVLDCPFLFLASDFFGITKKPIMITLLQNHQLPISISPNKLPICFCSIIPKLFLLSWKFSFFLGLAMEKKLVGNRPAAQSILSQIWGRRRDQTHQLDCLRTRGFGCDKNAEKLLVSTCFLLLFFLKNPDFFVWNHLIGHSWFSSWKFFNK